MTVRWLLKSEPGTYSWADLVKDKGTRWDGVRNYTARNNLLAMKAGDRAFFYHSGDDKAVVAIVTVTREAYPDPGIKKGDPELKKGWVAIDIAPVEPLKKPVTLAALKADKQLQQMVFVRQSRLSVSPVSDTDAKALLKLAR